MLSLFLMVFGAQFAFGMWINSRGFILADAYSRAANALIILYSTDPHLGAVGFIWMPLPSLLELVPTAFYPIWPQVVSSGFASSLTTAIAGGANAALLLFTARRLGVSARLGWVYALLISANPMLFLYASNGMSEGVAAPFLTGSVCFLTLFWHSGQRRYVTAAGLALALGFASLYEAVPYGAALFAALVLGLLLSSESKESAPQGRWRAVEGLGILLLLPTTYLAASWVGANAAIMKDPFYFLHSQYSNYGHTAKVGGAAVSESLALARQVRGDALTTFGFVTKRVVPFLIPGSFLLLLRALDGRFWRVNTFILMLMLVSVPFGLFAPLLYLGTSFAWLRYFIYPLFVAAGWGLYELASSKHSRLAVGLILAGWIAAAPVIFWAMTKPELGQEENRLVLGLVSGEGAKEVGFDNPLRFSAPVAKYLEEEVMPDNKSTTAVDAFYGWSIAAQMPPEYLTRLVVTSDRRFKAAIREPKEHNVSYLLVPNPDKVPQDEIDDNYSKLWAGDEPGFELVREFPETPVKWRLYKVL